MSWMGVPSEQIKKDLPIQFEQIDKKGNLKRQEWFQKGILKRSGGPARILYKNGVKTSELWTHPEEYKYLKFSEDGRVIMEEVRVADKIVCCWYNEKGDTIKEERELEWKYHDIRGREIFYYRTDGTLEKKEITWKGHLFSPEKKEVATRVYYEKNGKDVMISEYTNYCVLPAGQKE